MDKQTRSRQSETTQARVIISRASAHRWWFRAPVLLPRAASLGHCAPELPPLVLLPFDELISAAGTETVGPGEKKNPEVQIKFYFWARAHTRRRKKNLHAGDPCSRFQFWWGCQQVVAIHGLNLRVCTYEGSKPSYAYVSLIPNNLTLKSSWKYTLCALDQRQDSWFIQRNFTSSTMREFGSSLRRRRQPKV